MYSKSKFTGSTYLSEIKSELTRLVSQDITIDIGKHK